MGIEVSGEWKRREKGLRDGIQGKTVNCGTFEGQYGTIVQW